MTKEPDSEPGYDTAESCWLCDRETGQLCHVHDPEFREMRRLRRRQRAAGELQRQGDGESDRETRRISVPEKGE